MNAKRTGRARSTRTSAAQEHSSEATNWQETTLDGLNEAGQAYVNKFAAVNQEIVSFLQTRLQHGTELAQSLARCRTWTEATSVQSEWLKQTADEYTREARKLFALGANLMDDDTASTEQATTTPTPGASEPAEPSSK